MTKFNQSKFLGISLSLPSLSLVRGVLIIWSLMTSESTERVKICTR